MTALIPPHHALSYSAEIKRKLIHLSSLWMPAVIYFLPYHIAVIIFAILLVNQLVFEMVRRRQHGLARLVNRIFTPVLRPHETGSVIRFTGATYGVLAAFICALLFPVPVAVTALGIMLVADAAASLIGRHYGKTPLMGKTVEGCSAFLVSALAVIFLIGQLAGYPPAYYAGSVVAAMVATATELFSGVFGIDDNLSIPLAAGGAMWCVMALL